MKELGITKGEWYWDGDPTNYDHKNEAPWLIAGGVPIITGEIEAKNKADVDLIVDAGNTAQKCGLLPSELLQQRDELKEALIEAVKTIRIWHGFMEAPPTEMKAWEYYQQSPEMKKINAAIKKTDTK